MNTPPIPSVTLSETTKNVQTLIEQEFSDHPGEAKEFRLPVDRAGAHEWLATFIRERLAHFGPYEDAIPPRSDFLFHSVLTPFLNAGLLTPREVVSEVLRVYREKKLTINSIEGFTRQIIGWREFIRGVYQNHSEEQDQRNFFDHHRGLSKHWWSGDTGIPPLDNVIRKTNRYAYAHHIERLMVVGNLMLLLEIEPRAAHGWFMEMFIDSADWVMGPNVYGMAIFSDGGLFATKPYICGSNYYRKMGGYANDPTWCDGVDGLYWGFVEKHAAFFKKNPRLSMMARLAEKMDPKKKQRLKLAADELRARLTTPTHNLDTLPT